MNSILSIHIYLYPKYIHEKTPQYIKWLSAINESLKEEVDETRY